MAVLASASLLSLLCLALVYRAYVVIEPCRHDIKPLPDSAKINVTREQVRRFQQAITYETVSHSRTSQNESEMLKYIEFIRKGIHNLILLESKRFFCFV
jgi:hypothetical protein